MRCGEATAELLGWKSIYRIDLRDLKTPVLAEVAPLNKPGSRPAGFNMDVPNMAQLSSAVRNWWQNPLEKVPLQTTDSANSFELRIVATPPKGDEPCAVRVVSSVVQLDSGGS